MINAPGEHILTAGYDGNAFVLYRNSIKTKIRIGTPIYAGAWSDTGEQVILAGISASASVHSVGTGEMRT